MMIDNGLSVITVKKTELLAALKKNREAHKKDFEEARMGYRVAVVEGLQKMLDEAKSGKKYERVLDLDEPSDHTPDYDRRIRMLEMSVSEEIKVTEHEFTRYVLDEWEWKEAFANTSALYKGAVGAARR